MERPLTPQDAEELMLRIRTAMESGEERAPVRIMDTEIVLERSPDGSFTFGALGEAAQSRIFEGSDVRPIGYPAHLPFIPNEPVTFSQTGADAWSLIWWTPRTPDSLVAQLEQQFVAESWVLDTDPGLSNLPLRIRSFERAGAIRRLMVAAGMVTLLQTSARNTAP